ncbi:MAG: EAL and HDOD domain-containing protein [Sulfuricellaceae bacterium]|jgi:EAL and modified HD-GYP domain-containing signal transduction protein
MFDKIRQLITGKTRLESGQGDELTELQPVVPAVDEGRGGAPVIDTKVISPDNVVTSILDIQTSGEKTDAIKLRQRFIGRQTVYDRFQQVVGYELMLRHVSERSSRRQDDSLALLYDEMLLQCIADLNIERLLGGRLMFIDLSPASLNSALLDQLPGKGMVLVVELDAEAGEEHRQRLLSLIDRGYQLALDDFAYDPALVPLLRLARYVRIRVSRFDAIELGKQVVAILKGGNPELMANEVETEEDFDACHKLAFHFYQGHFFSRPAINPSQRVDNDRALVMDLLNKVMARADISELEEGFKHDAMLSYRLLRYINSAGGGVEQEIRSIAHGLFILGYEQLYRWLTLLLFTSGKMDERSRAVMKNALVRARLTEMLGSSKLGHPVNEGLFIVGIFSLLDALLRMPMDKILEHLHLPDAIVEALLHRRGVYAPYLELAIACEDFDHEKIRQLAEACGLDANAVNVAHVQALIWAEEVER